MMVIRTASVDDLPKMESEARNFYASSPSLKSFDMQRFVLLWTSLLSGGTGIIFLLLDGEEVKGALGGVIYPDAYSPDLIATEFFWWVNPKNRGRGLDLYYGFEEWAWQRKCQRIRMTHLCDLMPDGLKGLYESLGFKPVEINYEKELS